MTWYRVPGDETFRLRHLELHPAKLWCTRDDHVEDSCTKWTVRFPGRVALADYLMKIFISAATKEFGSYREFLRKCLSGPSDTVMIQEDFIATGTRTLDKLNQYISACDAVIHLVGDMTGACVSSSDISALKSSVHGFDVLDLDEFMKPGAPDVSYTQWEAYLAIHHNKTLLIAVPEDGAPRDPEFRKDAAQRANQDLHLSRLRDMQRYPEIRFANVERLVIEVLRSMLDKMKGEEAVARKLMERLAAREEGKARALRFGKDQVAELKHLLLCKYPDLHEENFLFLAHVQITGTMEPNHNCNGIFEADLIDRLAEQESVHELLMFAFLCEQRAELLGKTALRDDLQSWLSAALRKCKVKREAVIGHCSHAMKDLDLRNPASFSLAVAWTYAPADAEKRVFPEAYFKWGRCQHSFLKQSSRPLSVEEVVAFILECLEQSCTCGCLTKPLERIEVFVRREELNEPWEYQPRFSPDDEDWTIHGWPTVIRTHRTRDERENLKPAPDLLRSQHLACLMAERGTSLQEVRDRGAFFAAWYNCTCIDLKELSDAVSRAGIGIWLRCPTASPSAERILAALDGIPLASIPREIHERKRKSPALSEWRHVSVLYDHPGLPLPSFSPQISSDIRKRARMITALT